MCEVGCGALRFIACSILETYLDWIQASSILDIINDYTRFVIEFFEVITTSAPHIYHSAIPLSPRTSIIHNQYKRYARPLARVVWGALASWERSVATMYIGDPTPGIAWSPCNRFIAVAASGAEVVQLLDAATLGLLDVFELPRSRMGDDPLFSFSPGSRSLTARVGGRIIIWDLQTGGKAADFPAEYRSGSSSTYSIDGRLFAVLFMDPFDGPVNTITAHDLLLGTCKGHFRASTGRIVPSIWTHGGCIRFATVGKSSITISEVGFALAHAPIEVESFPAPDRIARADDYLFLPALSRLAFILFDGIEVWDARYSRSLLKCAENGASKMSFSTDGHLFAYMADWREIRVWKESATGYELHQRLLSPSLDADKLVLSPSGRAIVMASNSIYLLSTAGPTHPLSGISAPSSVPFILTFSTNGLSAAIARKQENTITVVNLKSGDCRLAVETGMEIRALGVTGSTLIAVDDKKVAAWTMPMGDDAFNARANINDSVRTTILDRRWFNRGRFNYVSISPGRNRIAAAEYLAGYGNLSIYDISTGKCLRDIGMERVGTPWFTPDGCEVWVVDSFSAERWAIVEDEESDLIELEPLESIAPPPEVSPRGSSSGHRVHEGWVLNSARERILWLPHHWRSEEWQRVWSGQFLGLLHEGLPEAVILELCD